MIRLGIIGTGAMGEEHADAFAVMDGVTCVACCDVNEERASTFADKYGIEAVYEDSTAFFEHAGLDAVSIVTTDKTHAGLALQAIDTGLHVLCEKPLATSVDDARKMSEVATAAGIIHLVNFSYRRSAALMAARDLIGSGEIGRLIHFEAHYLQSWLVSKKWGDWHTEDKWLWRLSTEDGSGGVLGDIGVHLLDFVTFPAGDVKWLQCELRTFPKADGDRIGEYVLDANDSAVITLSLAGGALGTVHMSRWATGHLNSIGLSLFGDKGALRIDLDDSYDTLQCCMHEDVETATWRRRICDPTPSVLMRFVKSIRTGSMEQPDFARGAYVQKLLQASFDSYDRQERVYL